MSYKSQELDQVFASLLAKRLAVNSSVCLVMSCLVSVSLSLSIRRSVLPSVRLSVFREGKST